MMTAITVLLAIGVALAAIATSFYVVEALVWRKRSQRWEAEAKRANERIVMLTIDRDFWMAYATKRDELELRELRKAVKFPRWGSN